MSPLRARKRKSLREAASSHVLAHAALPLCVLFCSPAKKAPAKKTTSASTARKPPARTAAKKATESITLETDESSGDSEPSSRRKRR